MIIDIPLERKFIREEQVVTNYDLFLSDTFSLWYTLLRKIVQVLIGVHVQVLIGGIMYKKIDEKISVPKYIGG